MRIASIFSVCMLTACIFSACNTEGSLPLGITQEMMTASKGKLITDSGITFNLTNSSSTFDLTHGRYWATCEIMDMKSETEYDVRLTALEPAISPDILVLSQIPEGKLGTDPICIHEDFWLSGNYINMRNSHFCLPDSDGTHAVNLVFDDIRSHDDSLFFILSHNSHGEKPDNPEYKDKTFVLTSYFTSVSFKDYIPAGSSKFIVTLDWKWYTNAEYEIKDYTKSAKYEIKLY